MCTHIYKRKVTLENKCFVIDLDCSNQFSLKYTDIETNVNKVFPSLNQCILYGTYGTLMSFSLQNITVIR